MNKATEIGDSAHVILEGLDLADPRPPENLAAAVRARYPTASDEEVARIGALVRPSSIQTLAQFLDTWARPNPAPISVIVSLVEQSLQQFQVTRFAEVSDLRSLHHAVAQLIEEAHGLPLGGDWAMLRSFVESELAERGLAPRNARLRSAAAALKQAAAVSFGQVTFDGFFTLSHAELDLIVACAGRTWSVLRYELAR